MSPNYKLIYFDTPGRAQLIRLLFAHAGVDFEDYRMAREDWPKLKPEMPFGQVPVLEVDGKKLSQSNTIARYVARQLGLTGNDAWDAAVCDQYVDAINDVLPHLVTWKYTGKTEEDKEAAKKTLLEQALPALYGTLTRAMEKNPEGLLVCDKITWADIYLASIALFLGKETESLSKFTAIWAHKQKVVSSPNLKAYLEKQGQ